MAKKKRGAGDELLETALQHFADCEDAYGVEYERGREDSEFTLGINQWPPDIASSRQKAGRPCLTENRMLPFVHQVVNDIRQTRPAVVVNPVDNKGDRDIADILQGIIRNIEYTSDANTAYDMAAWNAITAGYGWLRVHTCYADEESFNKEIKILRVPMFNSVFLDPNSREADGSDAEYAFVYCDMPIEKFKREYPNAAEVSFSGYGDSWATDKTVRIAEYFYRVYEEKTICQMPDGSIVSEEECKAMGVEPINRRRVQMPKVKWAKITGAEVLEETDWEGIYIPIVPVYGLEVWQDNRRRSYSLVHQAKDPQRRLNYWLSASTEIIALQPKAPFILMEGQQRGNEDLWETANTDNLAYLTYAPVELPNGQVYLDKPQRQNPPAGSPAMTQEMLFAADGIKSTLGIFNASLGERGNETSGKAILARQAEGDNATFHFSDNLANSIRQLGRIIVDLIPKIYTNAQMLRIIGEDGTPQNVPVNQVAIKSGKKILPYQSGVRGDLMQIDLGAGKYDVVCRMGASYATKRQEAANTLLELAKSDPRVLEVGGDIIADSLDIPYADVLAKRIKRMIPANILGDEGEGDETQQMQMAAQQQIQALQQQIMQMEAALQEKANNEQQKAMIEQQKLALEAEKLALEKEKLALDYQIEMQKLNQQQMATSGAMTSEEVAVLAAQVQQLATQVEDVRQATAIQLDIEEEKDMEDSVPPALMQALTTLQEAVVALSKPKRLVKDKDGNIIGAVPVDSLQT